MTLGRLIYLLYHRPIGQVKTCIREGGPVEQWKTERGRRAMEAAAWQLTSIGRRDQEAKRQPSGGRQVAYATNGLRDEETKRREEAEGQRSEVGDQRQAAGDGRQEADGGKSIEVHVLTGKRFWYQTAFCLWSLAKASGREVRPHIYDDGSMKSEHAAYFKDRFPNVRLLKQEEIIARLDRFLPASKFPRLRERWLHYPNIRKLTDPHAGQRGWKLVIDSDLLFFRSPDALLRWADDPDRPLHAVDSETAYGYPIEEMSRLAGNPVVDRLNVGLCGLKSEALEWERLEYWCEQLISAHGTHYYLEQALVAMLVAGEECTVLPVQDYITLPRGPEASRCEAVMHHYVSTSKPWYFRTNWRRIASMNS